MSVSGRIIKDGKIEAREPTTRLLNEDLALREEIDQAFMFEEIVAAC